MTSFTPLWYRNLLSVVTALSAWSRSIPSTRPRNEDLRSFPLISSHARRYRLPSPRNLLSLT